jgi:pimeloyl-ACP methyl ester carboxylesterase
MRLLLLNGVYGATEHFDALREALAPEIETRVLPLRREGLPDPAGHDAFAPLVDRLDRARESFAPDPDDPPALFGFSLGGALALEYVLAHPHRVSSLILVNAFGRYSQGPLHAASAPALRTWPPAWAHPALTARIVHRVAWLRRGLFHPEAPLDAIERGVRAAVGSVTHDDVRFQLAHLDLGMPVDLAARLAAAAERTPMLLVASRDDAVVPPRHTEWLASAMPGARRLPPFEGGHAFFQHDAGALADAVREFLGVSSRTPS